MDLIPRYLQAVRFWLPKKQQDDIIAELSEDIRAQLIEKEAALGRPLTAADVEALLRQRGSPIMVANRYLPQQSLIGPPLFPIYRFVLKVVTLCILIPAGLGWLVALLSPAVHAGGHHWASYFGVAWDELWTAWFVSMGVVTLVFAILERTHAKAQLLEDWNPRKLPPLRHPHSIPRSSSVIEIAVNLCVVAWWAANMASPQNLHIGSLRLSLSPAWTWFFWAVLVLTVASACIAAVNLIRPWWTTARVAARLCLDVAGSAFFCWLLKANVIAAIDWPSATPDKAAFIVSQVNLWLARMFPFAILVSVIILATNLYRLARLRKLARMHPMRPAEV